MAFSIVKREQLPDFEILLSFLKETGELKLVVEKCGYEKGSLGFQSAYRLIRKEFYNQKDENWKIYWKTSRNQNLIVQALRMRKDGMKYNEIAEKLNIPCTTVVNMITRNIDEFERSRLTTIAWANGHSKKSISNLTNQICRKRRLINLGMKKPICEECGWDFTKLEKYLKIPDNMRKDVYPLHLHHIDANRKNNNIENLKFLCPNCHALEISTSRSKARLERLQNAIITD